MPFDPARATLGSGQESVLGLYVHRGGALPVVDLPAVLGFGPSVPGDCCLLLVRLGEAQVGYLARELRAIERSVWEEDHDGSVPRRGGPAGLGSRPSLQIGEGTERYMVPLVDLLGLAAELLGLEQQAPVDADRAYPDHAEDDQIVEPDGEEGHHEKPHRGEGHRDEGRAERAEPARPWPDASSSRQSMPVQGDAGRSFLATADRRR